MKKSAIFLLIIILFSGVSAKSYAFNGAWMGIYGSVDVNMDEAVDNTGGVKSGYNGGFTIGGSFQGFLLGFLCLRAETEVEWQAGINGHQDVTNWNWNFGARVYLTLLYIGGGVSMQAIGNESVGFYSRWYAELGVSIPLGGRQMLSVGLRYLQPYTENRMQTTFDNFEGNMQIMLEWDHKL